MEKTLHVAKMLYNLYYQQKGVCMDEMKMHKLMYFSQRESLMNTNEPLFNGVFYGWKYGPVLKEVRDQYFGVIVPFAYVSGTVRKETVDLLQKVLERYGSLSFWKLSCLSHEEFSWKKSRVGLESGDDGDVQLSLDAMRVDAVKERVARKRGIQ